jgi:hypothetical protein
MICCTSFVAPALALVQNLAPVSARATATALLLLSFNIIGLGGGPPAVGVLSDVLAAGQVADPLRLALIGLAPVGLLSALVYFAVSKVVTRDTAAILEARAA